MPFNASGIFQRLFSWRDDRDAGIKILAERMDQEMDGFAAGINDIVQGETDFKGPVTAVYGTAAAPAFSFQSDPDTGVYRSGTNTLATSAGGSKALEVRQDEVESFVDFKKGTLAIDGNYLSFEGGHHWITYDDGAGDFNIRAGHKVEDGAEVYTSNGRGAVHLQLQHEANSPKLEVRVANAGALGADVTWTKTLIVDADGNFTWGGDAIWHEGNVGSGSELDADKLDGLHSSSFIRGDGDDNGNVVIRTDESNFIVRDAADSLTNFIFRDQSLGKLYLGSPDAVVTLRSDIDLNGNNFVGDLLARDNDKVGSGSAYIEGDKVVWGDEEHRITNNDGGGNANIRFGHHYSSGAKVSRAGGSGVHLEATVDNGPSEFAIHLFDSGDAVGDPISIAYSLDMSANGDFTWGGNAIAHEGRANTYSALQTFDGLSTFNGSVDFNSVGSGVEFLSDDSQRTFITLDQSGTNVWAWKLEANGDLNFDSIGGLRKLQIDGNEVMHRGNGGAGSGFDADRLDGLHATAFVRSDNENNGTTNIQVEGADFRIRDDTEPVSSFIFRQVSSQKLYLGSPTAEVSLRSKLWLNDSRFDGVDVGRGDVYIEDHADDGDGAGICIRSSDNPTTGHIFSVRSNGGALGLGVGQTDVRTGRSDIYVNTDDEGSGGHRVLHNGISAGSVGSLVFAQQFSGTMLTYGDTTAGSNLEPEDHNVGAAPSRLNGTWRCLGNARTNDATLFMRIA